MKVNHYQLISFLKMGQYESSIEPNQCTLEMIVCGDIIGLDLDILRKTLCTVVIQTRTLSNCSPVQGMLVISENGNHGVLIERKSISANSIATITRITITNTLGISIPIEFDGYTGAC